MSNHVLDRTATDVLQRGREMSGFDAAIAQVRLIDFEKHKEAAGTLALVEAGCDPQQAPAKKRRVYDVSTLSSLFDTTSITLPVEELLEHAQDLAAYYADSGRNVIFADVRVASVSSPAPSHNSVDAPPTLSRTQSAIVRLCLKLPNVTCIFRNRSARKCPWHLARAQKSKSISFRP